MKKAIKFLVYVIAVMMIASCVVNAGMYDDVFNDLTLSEYALYESGTLDAVEMRSFAVDPNGKYYYAGLLNGGTPTVYQFDVSTKEAVCEYQFADDPGAYMKAISADDRGYVYMGVANSTNNGAVYFAICKEANLEEVKNVKIDIDGKVGVNGCCVWHSGDKYYLYFVTNYDTDRIYCYDVTDVSNPVLNTAFGNNGYVDLNSTFSLADCNNICVGSDGILYLACNTGTGTKGDTIFKIDAKGTGWMASTSIAECFGVCTINGYLAVCTYNGADSKLYILNQSDLSIVKEVSYADANNFCQVGVIGNKLFLNDQGPDAILATNEIIFPQDTAADTAAEDASAETAAVDAGNNNTAADTTTPAPATGDTAVIALTALALSAAAAFVFSKKH